LISIPRTTQFLSICGYINGIEEYSPVQLANPATITIMTDSLEGPRENLHPFPLMTRRSGKLKTFLTIGLVMAEDNSW